jgi:hypothetical protein
MVVPSPWARIAHLLRRLRPRHAGFGGSPYSLAHPFVSHSLSHMPKIIPDALLKEAIRLRVEERLGLEEIHRRTGIAKSTLSVKLKPYPLSPEELSERMSLSANTLNVNHPLYDSAPEVFRMRPERSKAERRTDAVAAVAKSLAAHGYTMVSDGSEVHMRFLVENAELVVRVRTAQQGKVGRPRVTSADRLASGSYVAFSEEQCDVIAAVDPTSGHVFVIPIAKTRKETVCHEAYVNAWPLPKLPPKRVRRAKASAT